MVHSRNVASVSNPILGCTSCVLTYDEKMIVHACLHKNTEANISIHTCKQMSVYKHAHRKTLLCVTALSLTYTHTLTHKKLLKTCIYFNITHKYCCKRTVCLLAHILRASERAKHRTQMHKAIVFWETVSPDPFLAALASSDVFFLWISCCYSCWQRSQPDCLQPRRNDTLHCTLVLTCKEDYPPTAPRASRRQATSTPHYRA